MVELGLLSPRAAPWQLEPACIGSSTDSGLRLTQAVATGDAGSGSTSEGPCVDHGGVAELSCAPGLSRLARAAGAPQHCLALSSTLSRDTTVFYFLIGGFSSPEGRLARGCKPPAFSRFLFQSAV